MIELLTLMLLPLLGAINSQNFPDVLSSDEETKYLEAWRNKDFEARNKLIEHNLRLVAHIVKKFENTGIDKDDLLSIGTFGLIKAIEFFNPDKKYNMLTPVHLQQAKINNTMNPVVPFFSHLNGSIPNNATN